MLIPLPRTSNALPVRLFADDPRAVPPFFLSCGSSAMADDFNARRRSRKVDVDSAHSGQAICSALGRGNGGEQKSDEEQVDFEGRLGYVVKEQESPKAQA